MNLFKLFSTVTKRAAEPSGRPAAQALPEPRMLQPAEVAAVAGGPVVRNDGV